MKKHKKPIFILIGLIVIVLAGVGGFYKIKQHKKSKVYSQAEQFFQQKDYSAAKELFNQLGSYKDSAEWIKKCDSQPELDSAASLMEQGEYEQAREIYKKYNLQDNYNECTYQLAISYADSKEYEKSLKEFEQISSYKDSSSKFQDLAYRYARSLFKGKKYSDAKTYFEIAGDYKKAKKYLDKCNLANKYSAFDITNSIYIDNIKSDNSNIFKIYEEMESLLSCFYGTWYDVSGGSIVIDKFSISENPYYITNALLTNSHPFFRYEDTTGSHEIFIESTSDPVRGDVTTIIFDDTIRYYNIGGAELQEFLEEEEKLEKEEEQQRQKQANEDSSSYITDNNSNNSNTQENLITHSVIEQCRLDATNLFKKWYKNTFNYGFGGHISTSVSTSSSTVNIVVTGKADSFRDHRKYTAQATFLVSNGTINCLSFNCG